MPNGPNRGTLTLLLALVVTPAVAGARQTGAVAPGAIAALLDSLSSDAMLGRQTGSDGSRKAAGVISRRMRAAGLTPAGDRDYFQTIPLARADNRRIVIVEDRAARDTFPADRRLVGGNVVGVLAGYDPALRDEVVLVTAHYDHIGVRQPVNGDSINNGADDNASGTVAMLEVARLLAATGGTRRTLIFVAFTGEELGGLGTRWYLLHPTRPLDKTVANLNIEMIGRPDSLAGGPGRAWLTGYERSTMGDGLAAAGIPIVPDPRPDQNFFRRSDNYAFALQGIPAHTLSSFNLHSDYHRPSDEAALADPDHMAQVIEATARAVRMLGDGPTPSWKPGGRPEPRRAP